MFLIPSVSVVAVAQLVEPWIVIPVVVGSSPISHPIFSCSSHSIHLVCRRLFDSAHISPERSVMFSTEHNPAHRSTVNVASFTSCRELRLMVAPMEKQTSHYENLKVTHDAPVEVIRAAYRSLVQKYHPDRNNGSETATQMMKLLNVAYETLTDLAKRQQYDVWIGSDENAAAGCMKGRQPAPEVMSATQGRREWRIRPARYGRWYLLAILCIWAMIDTIGNQRYTASPRYVASPMIFETSLAPPSLFKLAEAKKPGINVQMDERRVLRPHYRATALAISAGDQAEKRADAVTARYDMSRVLEDL